MIHCAFYCPQPVSKRMSEAMCVKTIKVFLQPFAQSIGGIRGIALCISDIFQEQMGIVCLFKCLLQSQFRISNQRQSSLATPRLQTFRQIRPNMDKDHSCAASKFFQAYRDWCSGAGRKPQSQTAFKRSLEKITGVYQHRSSNGLQWHGIQPCLTC